MAAEREFDEALHEAGVEAAKVLTQFLKNSPESSPDNSVSEPKRFKIQVALQVLAIANDLPTPPLFIKDQ